MFTNLFLLQHSSQVPELYLNSEAEYRMFYELKRRSLLIIFINQPYTLYRNEMGVLYLAITESKSIFYVFAHLTAFNDYTRHDVKQALK